MWKGGVSTTTDPWGLATHKAHYLTVHGRSQQLPARGVHWAEAQGTWQTASPLMVRVPEAEGLDAHTYAGACRHTCGANILWGGSPVYVWSLLEKMAKFLSICTQGPCFVFVFCFS